MLHPCLECARKHLAKAEAYMGEATNGYPGYEWLAVGEIAMAEHELLGRWPDMARTIRQERILYIESFSNPIHYEFPTLDLIRAIGDLEQALRSPDDADHPEAGPVVCPAPGESTAGAG